MDLVFQAHAELCPTENHIKQLHQLLLKHSPKDERHRGRYKTLTNHVVAKDAQGVQVGSVRRAFSSYSPFSRWQWSLISYLNYAAVTASGLCVCALCIFGTCD